MANRYWVGGTAAWDGTAGTKWALTSGGAGGQSVPTSVDDVFFDAASGVVTCTISTGNTGAKSINCTGFTGTLAGTATISVSGSITYVPGMTLNYFGRITILASANIITAGKTTGSFTISGTGITVTLGSALTIQAGGGFTLTGGTFSLNGYTLSTPIFSSTGTLTRSIAFGTSNIALTSTISNAIVVDMATVTNFTWTGTGGFTRNQAATATVTFGPTGATSTNAPNLSVTSGASALTISTNTSFKALTLTGSTCTASGSVNIYGVLTLASGGTYTSLIPTFFATQTFNSLGKTLGGVTVNSSGITITLGDALTVVTTGVATLVRGTIDLNGFTLSAGSFSASTTNARSIVFGSANIALSSAVAGTTVLSMSTATNFTYTGTGGFTRNMAAAATMVFGTTGGSVSNAPNLAVNAGVNGLTITANSWFKNFNFTGTTGSITSTNVNIAGDITIPLAVNVGPCSITFRASGTATTNIKSFANITLNAPGGVITCADGLSANTALTLVDGTLKLKDGATSDFGSIVTTGTTLKYLASSTPGVQATITDPTGTNTVTYLSIQDSNATGGAVFDATNATNVNAGNNTGWLFAVGGGNFFLLF